jgi:hypothetical protein
VRLVLILLLFMIVTIPMGIAVARANELFVLRWRGGRLRVVRGRIPQRLLDDIHDILRRAGIGAAYLRGVTEQRRAALYVEGDALDAGVRQRLRNAIGQWPVAKIRAAPRRRGGAT